MGEWQAGLLAQSVRSISLCLPACCGLPSQACLPVIRCDWLLRLARGGHGGMIDREGGEWRVGGSWVCRSSVLVVAYCSDAS